MGGTRRGKGKENDAVIVTKDMIKIQDVEYGDESEAQEEDAEGK